ncbi:MAG: hypothetical protein MUF49_09965 [Oculatellaceae cyanobacterium Prado106]|jgi:hypothetical protein|nr:hypothetical protein [Oculatellaceae cyanobacterium Prado106]
MPLDFLPNVIPLRAIFFQIVLLLMAIAIEATVLHNQKQLDIDPRRSVQYASGINLLTTVLGWLVTFFILGAAAVIIPEPLRTQIQVALLSFIFFDQWTLDTLQFLVIVATFTFLISLVVKWLGVIGEDWLMKKAPPPTPEQPVEDHEPVFRKPRRTVIRGIRPRFNAVFLANAWSYSAILVALLLRFVFQATLNQTS